MDRAKAETLADKLSGTVLDGWFVHELVNHGKSAAVFRASKNGALAAIKVFDTELIERYGDQTQLSRIERELELRGKKHDNLVSIYGGGHDTDRDLYYIIMEYVDGKNLKEVLATIRVDQVPSLVQQLASAAMFLESLGLVHRDIKPENIAIVDEGTRLILLDFGVIRPIAGSDLTDPEGIHAFVGTLQYSSPEFLLREEDQTLDGWRALTFYQIGAVIHDLVTKRPLFEQFATPYAKLVNAVQVERPIIAASEAPPWLVQLAQRCLIKSPVARLSVVDWSDFAPSKELQSSADPRLRVEERLVTVRAQSIDLPKPSANPPSPIRLIRDVLSQLRLVASSARTSLPSLPAMRQERSADEPNGARYIFQRRAQTGFPHGLTVQVWIEVVDVAESIIRCRGAAYFPGRVSSLLLTQSTAGTWFEGAFDGVALHQAFERFIFSAIDWCLELSPAVDDEFDGVFYLSHGSGSK